MVCNRPSTLYERAFAHPKVSAAVKKRLRDQYRSLDPVALLAEFARPIGTRQSPDRRDARK